MLQQFDFLKIVEKAAIKASEYKGTLNKYKADEVATDTMREELNKLAISATVVIGEGEMDEAPMLYIGEILGKGGVELDIAVDPLDGTILASKNQNNSITVLALSEKGSFLNAPDMYMKKMATGSYSKGMLDITKSLTENLNIYHQTTLKPKEDIKVVMLDRDRHTTHMKEVVDFGAKLVLISDGDVLPGILIGIDNKEFDILFGIGAAPEGVITAAALKCLGGDFQGILLPQDENQKKRCEAMGILDPENTVFNIDDLVKSDNILVVLTALTDGYIGKGVSFDGNFYITNSLKISSKEPTVKYITSRYKK